MAVNRRRFVNVAKKLRFKESKTLEASRMDSRRTPSLTVAEPECEIPKYVRASTHEVSMIPALLMRHPMMIPKMKKA
jgi:hypothetical protein